MPASDKRITPAEKAAADRRNKEAANRATKAAADRRDKEAANRAVKAPAAGAALSKALAAKAPAAKAPAAKAQTAAPRAAKAPAAKQKFPSQLGLTRLSPGIYRNKEGELVNTLGRRIDRSGRSVKIPPGKDGKVKPPKQDVAPPAPIQTGAEFATPFTEQTPGQQQTNIGTESGQSVIDYFGQLQQQGAFNPGDYAETYRQAVDNVMGEFELQNKEQFQFENSAMEQQIAERGIDPQGVQARRMRDQLYNNQDKARQQSMYQGEQFGRSLQQQRFEQDLSRYNVPASQLQAIQGYFAGQLGSVEAEKQRKYEAAQAEKDRQNRLQLGKMGGGSNADPFAIMAAEYGYKRDLLYDANALNSGQPSGGGIGNSVAQGIGTGIGAGIIGAVS